MIWYVGRISVIRSEWLSGGRFGRDKILVILGIGYLLYPFGTTNFYLGRSRRILTPIPSMHWRWYNKRNVMYCPRCVGQRIEHPHFMVHCYDSPRWKVEGDEIHITQIKSTEPLRLSKNTDRRNRNWSDSSVRELDRMTADKKSNRMKSYTRSVVLHRRIDLDGL